MNLRQLDKKHFGRQGEAMDVIVGNSAETYLTDAHGRKYIDFMSGWCVGNLGWGNTEIRAAAAKFDGPDYVHPDCLYRPRVQLAEILARITPGKLATAQPAGLNPLKVPFKSRWPTPGAASSYPSRAAIMAIPSPP